MHLFTTLRAPRLSSSLCCCTWKGSVASSIGGSSGLQKFQEIFPLPCSALPLVVLAISWLVTGPGTSWRSPVVVARCTSPWQALHMSVFGVVEHLDSSLGHLAIEHFCDIADILYSLSIHHWLFWGVYWGRWTYGSSVKHKTELQFVVNCWSIPIISWFSFSNNFFTSSFPQ